MIDTQSHPDFLSALRQVDELCRKVGFGRIGALPLSKLSIEPPPASALWSSVYAHILFWPVDLSLDNSLERQATAAEGWLDDFLSSYETKMPSGPLDGYLVLALSRPPIPAEQEAIRHLELSSRICRKHLIWPKVEDASGASPECWQRVADVTVLGLPEAGMAGASELVWPNIGAEAESIWADLERLGVSETVQKDAME